MTQKQKTFLQKAEAEVLSEEGYIKMLIASNKQKKQYLAELQSAYEEIEQLKNKPKTISVQGDYVENKYVGKQVNFPKIPKNICQKKDQI